MRNKSLTREVRKAYNQDTLSRTLTMPERDFSKYYGMETVTVDQPSYRLAYGDPEDYYHFRDSGSSVLAVAHLDTVVRPDRRAPRFSNTKAGPLVVSGALDDRLGAYVILSLLPQLGVSTDVLLTVGEESGCSTAGHFKPPKDYDWIIEFDRTGTDVVMYQYEDLECFERIEASGAATGYGSFSDIAYLEHCGVKAFNWGVGYRGDYHSEKGYAYLDDTFSMVAKYMRFHDQNLGTCMTHEPEYRDDRYRESYSYDCISCGAKDSVDTATWYCEYCGICQDCGATNPDIAREWDDPDADVCDCYVPSKYKIGA